MSVFALSLSSEMPAESPWPHGFQIFTSIYHLMKQALLSLSACLFFTVAMAQTTALEQTDPDSVINVIAFFCKNDSTVYTCKSNKWKVTGKDTITEQRITLSFLLAVTDSTQEGYKLVYTPLSFKYESDKEDMMKAQATTFWDLVKNLRPEFLTDEMGTITHLTNWREIRDVIRKGNKVMLDTLYAGTPAMDSVVPRKRMESLMALKYSSEQGIMEAYEEVLTLFNMHGKQMNIGITEADDSTSYPSHTKIVTHYEQYDDGEDCYEGDFAIQAETVTTLSKEETAALVGNVFNVITTGKVAEQMSRTMDEHLNTGLTITNLEDYHYFYNGWPRLMRRQKITKVMDQSKIEESTIEWEKHRWGSFGEADEEPKANM